MNQERTLVQWTDGLGKSLPQRNDCQGFVLQRIDHRNSVEVWSAV